ncbi:putative E3 ubiquitin ligase complex SCF subunit sconB [Rhizoctonia solani]|uniref:Putative E3 ubiquitin ligase complex SCF subunit sconB n=1 Tax=Rhizoctonia solani TaxID=456999 RepID=A0A0K6G8N9_9AGAM|nr:putative E3 ubiquitin ligase complex SCF subunit sconB [Rhizoctonia solani]
MQSHSAIYPRITDFDDGSVTNSGPPSPPTTTTVLGLANMHIHSGPASASSVSLASTYESVIAESVASGSSGSGSSRPVACDTVRPPQKLALRVGSSSPHPASPPALVETSLFEVPVLDENPISDVTPKAESSRGLDFAPPGRKLCVRHQRMADEGMSSKLQRSLDALPIPEREAVSSMWSAFSSSSHPRRALILQGLLTMCCFSELSILSEQLTTLIRIDPFLLLPREVCLKILGHLDAISLMNAAQVSRPWRALADDDVLWRMMCEQHIEKRCLKCGWGLPLLERRRSARQPSHDSAGKNRLKRLAADDQAPLLKRARSEPSDADIRMLPLPSTPPPPATTPAPSLTTPTQSLALSPRSNQRPESGTSIPSCVPGSPGQATRPWKQVYCERLSIERNWRRGRYTQRTLKGHTDGVMCLQFNERLSHPSFPVLITGSYDRTVRVWNMETGAEVQCLQGHARAIRALQFDAAKLITGSMDHTLRVWNWRNGTCVRTLEGHTEGVVCLNYDSNVLASGSADMTVKVWNFRTGECFTLRGHRDWVNAVHLWDGPGSQVKGDQELDIDPGKMLFSASDDGSIRLWDLNLRTCVRQFAGHVGQVQSIRLVMLDGGCGEDDKQEKQQEKEKKTQEEKNGPVPVLISGSLDNTIRIWDVESGKARKTLFGHIEGVWSVQSDKLRVVSASHDRTIKVWNHGDGTCVATLVGHRGAVTCLALGDDKIVSGSDDGDVRLWSFTSPTDGSRC